MAIGLKKDKKGTVRELISVMRTFNSLEPVEIVRAGGEQELYDSLVFANVARITSRLQGDRHVRRSVTKIIPHTLGQS